MPKGIAIVFWFVSVPCTAMASILAFRIFAKLKEAGIERRWWKNEDIRLYRLYWRMAPDRGWPRGTLLAAACFFAAGGGALLLMAVLYWGR